MLYAIKYFSVDRLRVLECTDFPGHVCIDLGGGAVH